MGGLIAAGALVVGSLGAVCGVVWLLHRAESALADWTAIDLGDEDDMQ